MREKVSGVSHRLCLSVIFMTLVEDVLGMILLLLNLRLLLVGYWITGLATQRKELDMLVLRIKEQLVTGTYSYRLCTTYHTSERRVFPHFSFPFNL
ncbi:hypothetical protein V6N13_035697 [Hibiscus sabdariffa]|uniref:Uncharacterized protein n=1 Tax=Hibiscus sabdariffa TaxID=183260 RepID=A0ABR2S963_9ROSI